MSPEQREDLDQLLTVFEGCSPEDASHARQLWSSLSLMPPQESRLVSADIHQRLPVSRPPQPSSSITTAVAGVNPSAPQPPSVLDARQREEERRRYLSMADQRREILALLRRQREQRIQKELLSVAFKPKEKTSKGPKPQKTPDSQTDRELVRQLH